MANLKPGGLALVLKSIIPENIGIIVTLVKYEGKRISFATGQLRDCWTVSSSRDIKAIQGGVEVMAGEVLCPTEYLMPIDDENPDQSIVKFKDLENVK